MKKLLFAFLVGFSLSPLQIFADHYPDDELQPVSQPPLRSPIVHHAQFVEGNSFTLDTSSWSPGIYIIRANIEGKPCSAKITLK